MSNIRKKDASYCVECGNKFFPWQNSTNKFCSRECYRTYSAKRNKKVYRERQELADINQIARECGMSYGEYVSKKKANFRPTNPKEYFGF